MSDKILIVDDSEEILAVMSSAFKRNGYTQLYFAKDGLEAFDLCQTVIPDLIVTDVNMPHCNGYELVAKLRQDPTYHLIPIIFLSAKISAHDQQQGFESGGDYYMCKPLFSDQKEIFFSMVKSFIERSKKQKFMLSSLSLDNLTGLPLRGSFHKDVEKQKESITLAILDIDKFKNINDTYGHNVGDDVIKQFSHLCRSSLRSEDKIYRWGGEEFVVMLLNTNLQSARSSLERIKKQVKEFKFKEGFSISFSAGICFLSNNESIEECIAKADKALYKAKQSGRDRIEIYE